MLHLNFTPFPEIETERLLLRAIRPTDDEQVFLIRSNEVVMKYIGREPAKTIDDARTLMNTIAEREQKNEAINWAITIKGDEKLYGTICIWNINADDHRGELGYVLHPSQHGKGVMNEAIKAIVNYGFDVMKLHSIEAQVNPANEASIKVLERTGFVKEAYFKENFFFRGQYFDTAVYSLLTPLP